MIALRDFIQPYDKKETIFVQCLCTVYEFFHFINQFIRNCVTHSVSSFKWLDLSVGYPSIINTKYEDWSAILNVSLTLHSLHCFRYNSFNSKVWSNYYKPLQCIGTEVRALRMSDSSPELHCVWVSCLFWLSESPVILFPVSSTQLDLWAEVRRVQKMC